MEKLDFLSIEDEYLQEELSTQTITDVNDIKAVKDKYNQFWFVTITPYGKDIEPNVPDKKQVIEDFKKLSDHVGVDSVALRYDPILINDEFDVNMHIKCFERLLSRLKGYTHDCTISFLDLYEKVKRNAPDLKPPTENEQKEIAKAFSKIGKENMKKHIPTSPFLIGEEEPGDKITEAKQKSWLHESYNQISLI